MNEKIGNGTITRYETGHICDLPGWWQRFFGQIKCKDIWKCDDCDQKWVWGYVLGCNIVVPRWSHI